ncbi:MAG: hypothetical protein V1859_09350 [archaeon]
MPLISYKGNTDDINRKLMLKAFECMPSLILDCGNTANPYLVSGFINEWQMHHVYVMNAEAIYRFRDALKELPYWSDKLSVKCLVITTIHTLFSYDNPEENYNVLLHCWELMKNIAVEYPVYVGIANDQMHEEFAKRFSDEILTI